VSETIITSIPDAAKYELKKRAADERIEPTEYVRSLILEDLGFDDVDDVSFDEYVVSQLNVSAEKRRRNVKLVSKSIYKQKKEFEDRDETFFNTDKSTKTIPKGVWETAVSHATTVVTEQEEDKQFNTYRTTVTANCSTDLGLNGVSQFRRKVAGLVKEYDT
jgi:hypothetical protein